MKWYVKRALFIFMPGRHFCMRSAQIIIYICRCGAFKPPTNKHMHTYQLTGCWLHLLSHFASQEKNKNISIGNRVNWQQNDKIFLWMHWMNAVNDHFLLCFILNYIIYGRRLCRCNHHKKNEAATTNSNEYKLWIADRQGRIFAHIHTH